MDPIVSVIILIALGLVFIWLAVRAARSSRPLVKWPGMLLSGLLALLLLAAVAVTSLGLYRLRVTRDRPVPTVRIEPSPELLAHGEDLAHLCMGCHSRGADLPLDGGTENFVAGIGTIVPPNLTPAGPLADWTDGEIIRAIRTGVDRRGRTLLIMPSGQYRAMSDADVRALVAYLRAQPAVDHPTPETRMNLIGTALVGAGVFPTAVQEPITAPVAAPPAGPTGAYGEYLVNISGCRECHGPDLMGGEPGGFVPAGPGLPRLVSQWSAEQFIETIRTGVNPYGRRLEPQEMPWPEFSAAFGDEEITAMYEYIRDPSAVGASETTELTGP